MSGSGVQELVGAFAFYGSDVRLDALSTLDDTMYNTEEIPVEKDIPSSVASTSGTKQHRKRSRSNDEIEKNSEKLGEVATALTKLSNNRLIVSDLYAELMKMKGYDDEFLATVFDHLVQNEMLALAFMAKSEKLRRISLDNFKKEKDLSFHDYYPERLGKLLIIHAPYIFMTAWKIFYPFIDTTTKKKIKFVEDKRLKATLLEDIDDSQLPEIYGGKLPLLPIQDA
ncbi:hypothetical protein ACH5RR_024779 [Cinchona calisaya]|uniref:CRAL-TRIO domain-containing protein n=1 Tax=Cinchona calisaya TaxID=153742 RepID=A0ABD2Z0Y0_9GENT